jgi:hypothetical protein
MLLFASGQSWPARLRPRVATNPGQDAGRAIERLPPPWPDDRGDLIERLYLAGVSTRRMDKLVRTLGTHSLSMSQVSGSRPSSTSTSTSSGTAPTASPTPRRRTPSSTDCWTT